MVVVCNGNAAFLVVACRYCMSKLGVVPCEGCREGPGSQLLLTLFWRWGDCQI